jgi:hypothetical protein
VGVTVRYSTGPEYDGSRVKWTWEGLGCVRYIRSMWSKHGVM